MSKTIYSYDLGQEQDVCLCLGADFRLFVGWIKKKVAAIIALEKSAAMLNILALASGLWLYT